MFQKNGILLQRQLHIQPQRAEHHYNKHLHHASHQQLCKLIRMKMVSQLYSQKQGKPSFTDCLLKCHHPKILHNRPIIKDGLQFHCQDNSVLRIALNWTIKEKEWQYFIGDEPINWIKQLILFHSKNRESFLNNVTGSKQCRSRSAKQVRGCRTYQICHCGNVSKEDNCRKRINLPSLYSCITLLDRLDFLSILFFSEH